MVLSVNPTPQSWWLAAPAALILAGLVLLVRESGDGDAPRHTGTVRVVDVRTAAVPVVFGAGRRSPSSAIVVADPPAEAVIADGDVAEMGELAHVQPRDARAAGDEVQLGTAIARALAPSRVTCTITLCAVEGRDAHSPAALEAALQAEPLLDALAAMGYSPGPARFGQGAAKDGFLIFLNRET